MPISTLDDLINAQAQGNSWDTLQFLLSGGAAHVAGNAYQLGLNANYSGTALAAVAPNDTAAWAPQHGGSVSPATKVITNHINMAVGANAAPGLAVLADVALYYPGINLLLNTAQTLSNAQALTRHTTGRGLRAIMVCTALTGTPAGTPVLGTFNYRNQAGLDANLTAPTINFTAGAAGIPPVAKVLHCAPAANHPGLYLPLNAGDTGIQRVNSITLSTAYTGATTLTAALLLVRPLLTVPLAVANTPVERNTLSQMRPVADGAALAWFYFAGAATAANSAFMPATAMAWA